MIAAKQIKAQCLKKKCLKRKKARFLRPPSPFKVGLFLAAPILAPLAPAAGFLGVMGAPIYGKNILPGTGGLVEFGALEKSQGTTNEYLARANPDDCPRFGGQELETGGGGGGAAVGPAPIYPGIGAADLETLFREVLTGLYVVPAYALPTLSNPQDKQFVFVQRTPLLRFPDVINVRFLDVVPGVDGGVEGGGDAAAPAVSGSSLLVHSKSVFGVDDLGTNRKRVVDLLARLDDAVDAWKRNQPGPAAAAKSERGLPSDAVGMVEEAVSAAASAATQAAEAAAELIDQENPLTEGGAGKGMSKAEVDAYIASVKADVDKIAQARISTSEEREK